MEEALSAILLPFLGTVIGSACVFFLKGEMNRQLQRALTGFAAGVMVAASVWSLIIPAMEQSGHMGKFSFLPAFVGVWGGFLFLLLLDHIIPHLHLNSESPEGAKSNLGRSTMMVLAVTLHNFPEGMAVGVVAAGWLTGSEGISAAGALALSLGIALQNLPEGAAISLPLRQSGMSRVRSFGLGVLSGAVEPVFGVLVVLAVAAVETMMPLLMAFAAGAMMLVVFEEMIPAAAGERLGVLCAMAGYVLMMALDLALG